jgi:hypothetical protein
MDAPASVADRQRAKYPPCNTPLAVLRRIISYLL